jgi:hypothetical protein
MVMVTIVMLDNLFKQLNITWCQVVSKKYVDLHFKIEICGHFIII